MKSKTFRLEESVVDQLRSIAEARGGSQTDALRFAIQKGYDALHEEYDAATAGEEVDWRALYLAERERCDSMAGRLLELSDKVADSLRAAQVLQAMDRPGLESAGQKEERRTRWQRLREAWRG